MTSSPGWLKLLLDEYYPGWLAERLCSRGIDTVSVAAREDLCGRDDVTVLETAAQELRTVVTEDVSTFSVAMAKVSLHQGVVFCHHARFPRTKPGLHRLEDALLIFRDELPDEMRQTPFVWWLSE